jgi:hypothetical protein
LNALSERTLLGAITLKMGGLRSKTCKLQC